MRYLLDTNTVSDLYNEGQKDFHKLNKQLAVLADNDQIYISVLTLYELEYGLANAEDSQKEYFREQITKTQRDFQVLQLKTEGASLFGEIKKKIVEIRNLQRKAARKHTTDIMLATTAMLEACTLVSADNIYPQIYDLYPQFQYQNWVADNL